MDPLPAPESDAAMPAGFIPIISPLFQRADQAAIREPGARLLSRFEPVQSEAVRHSQTALISVAAYGRTPGGHRHRRTEAYLDADGALQAAGWVQWANFPDEVLHRRVERSGLRVEVWWQRETNTVCVAFGGSVFSSWKDWRSNLRWFLPTHKDEYTEIVTHFGGAFIAEYRRRAGLADGGHLATAVLTAAGHSLGGGLAQEFAYSLPTAVDVPRVTQVHAFDPSPVTGYFSVERALREANQQMLAIDRVYERGEILSIVRSLLAVFAVPAQSCPVIRGVRYNVFSAFDPIVGHSIERLAAALQRVVGGAPRIKPSLSGLDPKAR